MREATAGAIVRTGGSGPPWIVVDHAVESVVAAHWPGRLWQVEILKAGRERPRAEASYTRALSVRVIGEAPVSLLFGPHGDLVCRVIEKASVVTLEEVSRLPAARHPLARRAYSCAWSRWLGRGDAESGEEHADTLAAPSDGTNSRSPIGSGFTVLYAVLTNRARELAGDAAFVLDDEGDPVFAPDWQAAADAFLHAAMAFGAPDLASSDAHVLIAAWETLNRHTPEA